VLLLFSKLERRVLLSDTTKALRQIVRNFTYLRKACMITLLHGVLRLEN
jgi:hypothetical protein